MIIRGHAHVKGFVTDVNSMLDRPRHWSGYYQCLETGRWSWLAVARQFTRLVMQAVKENVIHLAKETLYRKQIIGAIKAQKAGEKVADICHRLGIAEGRFYNWRAMLVWKSTRPGGQGTRS